MPVIQEPVSHSSPPAAVSPAGLGMKRAFDIVASLVGLIAISPLLLVVAALVKLTSRGPIIFCQERMGRDFRPFQILKFRSMTHNPTGAGRLITAGNDPRITKIGSFLRRTKLDELPQLFNVLWGEMSLVGPRPEVRRYVEMFPADFAFILSVRPGITDLASLEFRHEAELLGRASDPEREYVEHILPTKIGLSRRYLERRSFLGDMRLIFRTLGRLFG